MLEFWGRPGLGNGQTRGQAEGAFFKTRNTDGNVDEVVPLISLRANAFIRPHSRPRLACKRCESASLGFFRGLRLESPLAPRRAKAAIEFRDLREQGTRRATGKKELSLER